ncbi:uncharacterized protein LOC144113837 [Amblyomma americanum]
MAPTGKRRSRRHPRDVPAELLETRKQQTSAALRVTAERLTRPAERCFLNQREFLRASRNAEPHPIRLERIRVAERARLTRWSPSLSPPPNPRRSSRLRFRKRATCCSPSLLPSSSDASHAPCEKRRRCLRAPGAHATNREWSPETERRERLIVSRTLAELHRSLAEKRHLLQQNGKSVLSKVRSYLQDVALKAQREEQEEEKEEDIAFLRVSREAGREEQEEEKEEDIASSRVSGEAGREEQEEEKEEDIASSRVSGEAGREEQEEEKEEDIAFSRVSGEAGREEQEEEKEEDIAFLRVT